VNVTGTVRAVCDRVHTPSPNALVVLPECGLMGVFLVINRSRPPYGICCVECNTRLIAPICSQYERYVRHYWSCEECDHQFATSDDLKFEGLRSSTREEIASSCGLLRLCSPNNLMRIAALLTKRSSRRRRVAWRHCRQRPLGR